MTGASRSIRGTGISVRSIVSLCGTCIHTRKSYDDEQIFGSTQPMGTRLICILSHRSLSPQDHQLIAILLFVSAALT